MAVRALMCVGLAVLGGALSACGGADDAADGPSSLRSSKSTTPSAAPVASASPTPTPGGPQPTITSAPAPAATTGPAATQPNPSGLRLVTPTITYVGPGGSAGELEVSGIVSGVIEDGGRCTATLALGSTTRTASQAGAADASSTSCGTMVFVADGLSAGSWQVTLAYLSSTSQGSSDPVPVVIQ